MLAEGDPREVEDLARQVDELMDGIATATNSADSTRVAVLACFHLADKLRSAEQRLQAIEEQSARMDSLLSDALLTETRDIK